MNEKDSANGKKRKISNSWKNENIENYVHSQTDLCYDANILKNIIVEMQTRMNPKLF